MYNTKFNHLFVKKSKSHIIPLMFLLGCYILLIVSMTAEVSASHYRPPNWVEVPDDMTGSHCESFTATVLAKSRVLIPDIRLGTIRYRLLSGPGSIDAKTGVWEYHPTIDESGKTYTVVIAACEGNHMTIGRKACRFHVTVTNSSPQFYLDLINCGAHLSLPAPGNHSELIQTGDADHCDEVTRFLYSVEPKPAGDVLYSENGWLSFRAKAADANKTFLVVIAATDGKDTSYCELYFVSYLVIPPEPYTVKIESTNESVQGMHEQVDVTLETGSLDITGFDFLLSFNPMALMFQTVNEGQVYDSCDWEYFTYRYEEQLPDGQKGVRIIGMAETNNGPHHPDCYNLDNKPFTLFSLDFFVTNDRTFEGTHQPIKFLWLDCGDNMIAYNDTSDGIYPSIEVAISRYVFEDTLGTEITDPTIDTFPTYFGAPDICLETDNPPTRFIDFYNGAIDIESTDSVDIRYRGDLNLNGIPNEIQDANLYSNYFVYGIDVFDNESYEERIVQSDVNHDGIPLTIEDFTYQIRIIVGDALPFPPTEGTATFIDMDSAVYIETIDTLGTAHLVFEGNVAPVLQANGMEIKYSYWSDDDVTHVLIYKIGTGAFSSGLLLTHNDGTHLVEASATTYYGGSVDLTIESDSSSSSGRFTLAQNHPNPFNPSTTIKFQLPSKSFVELSIYDVLGRKVKNIVHETVPAGAHSVIWDGCNESGEYVGSGIYFYRLSSGDFVESKKMLLLK
ncbi:MAG: FlgD immunoglobulin-like domain containing protein [candidate division Zixibacteria bacterium]|nr:FlgD immunoglobulin-like domain containing protein [candidate division Zixibacteria bacterium]